MSLTKLVPTGAEVPKGYRIAYYSWTYQGHVTAPIGLHIIFRICRRLWELSFVYSPSKLEVAMRRQIHVAYKEGYRDACNDIDKEINSTRSCTRH